MVERKPYLVKSALEALAKRIACLEAKVAELDVRLQPISVPRSTGEYEEHGKVSSCEVAEEIDGRMCQLTKIEDRIQAMIDHLQV